MKNQWELWSQSVLSEHCDYIIDEGLKVPPSTATVGFNNQSVSAELRSSIIRWLDIHNSHKDIADLMMRYIRSSNRTNFGFDINQMNEVQFTEYHGTDNGKYDWHHDVDWENPSPYDRKLSIVIQLSDPTDYEGGDFEFFGLPSPGDAFKKRGSVLIFPSFFLHRVTPVTSGIRYSLVSWIEGPKFR